MRQLAIFVLAAIMAVAGLATSSIAYAKKDSTNSSSMGLNSAVAQMDMKMALHWHIHLKIVILGEELTVPEDIGIGTEYASHPEYDALMQMANMHTHDDSGIIHWEKMQGPVTADNLKLKLFFSVWHKQFNQSCIFVYCHSDKAKVRMFVNGKENLEFENYQIKDRDMIEIRYE